jgi:deoxyribodipyrimidine photo-lyase
MIQPERIRELNFKPLKKGDYVLYWMQASQRAEYNHALEYSIQRANKLKVPVVVLFGITDNYPDANLRHYYFMLEGLVDAQKKLQRRGIKFIVKHQSPEKAAVELSDRACLLVVDTGYTHIQSRWRTYTAKNINCSMIEVETNLIVPVWEASDKENFSAGTFRPRITAKLDYYLKKVRHRKPLYDSLSIRIGSFDINNIDEAVSRLDIDRSVKQTRFKGGTNEAKRLLTEFIKKKLDLYPVKRNDPNQDVTSHMSPYLHFGQISPLYIALRVIDSNSKGKEAYLEELIVRRELSHNYVFYNNKYDKYVSLPPWAKNTLNFHGRDKREYIYSLQDFEGAKTHDAYWNAAQKEMVLTGKMHGYMRMYWGKKILEWSKNPKEGFKIALYLNDKYELDGRDPNGYAGVAWCFGKHDRAWSERMVFGKIRYMNAKGLKRKFNADKYVCKVEEIENT